MDVAELHQLKISIHFENTILLLKRRIDRERHSLIVKLENEEVLDREIERLQELKKQFEFMVKDRESLDAEFNICSSVHLNLELDKQKYCDMIEIEDAEVILGRASNEESENTTLPITVSLPKPNYDILNKW